MHDYPMLWLPLGWGNCRVTRKQQRLRGIDIHQSSVIGGRAIGYFSDVRLKLTRSLVRLQSEEDLQNH
jgi:hypothetical protein